MRGLPLQMKLLFRVIAVIAIIRSAHAQDVAVTGGNAGAAQDQTAAAVLELGFEAGAPGGAVPDWIVPTRGWKAQITTEHADQGARSAQLFLAGESDAPFGNLMRTLDAAGYRGRHVRLSARIKVGGPGRAQMWLRADRSGGKVGAFDNMHDRPITAGDWTDAVIEADIDADAQTLNIGFMSLGGAMLFMDSVKLQSAGPARVSVQPPSPPRPLSPRGLDNVAAAARLLSYVRFFHPSDQAAAVKTWDHLAVALMEQAEPAADAADLARRLSEVLAPIAPTLQIWAGSPQQAAPAPPPPADATDYAEWVHHGAGAAASRTLPGTYHSAIQRTALSGPPGLVDHDRSQLIKELGGGVCCRLPVRVYCDGAGTLPHAAAPDELTTTEAATQLSSLNRATRLAAVALAWGILQHFYPYFDVVACDWDAALIDALRKAAEDVDEAAFLATLRNLMAQLQDGHADAFSTEIAAQTFLPVAMEWAGQDLVVAGVHDTLAGRVRIGDVLTAVDGRSTGEYYQDVSRRISAATEGWRRAKFTEAAMFNPPSADPVHLRLRRQNGEEYAIEAPRARVPVTNTAHPRPANGAEIAEGIVYFDLSGAETPALQQAMPALQKARGIIFDLRGYPQTAAVQVIMQLIDEPVASAHWNTPVVRLPDREGWSWDESGRWHLTPMAPRLKAKIAFLTDGRAISYAESILGIVEHYKLGEIVGSASAGTNGNVLPVALPGGFHITWTGMKVLKHDGSRHHGVGIQPTVPVTPTARGIAEGRDEVLERAVQVLHR